MEGNGPKEEVTKETQNGDSRQPKPTSHRVLCFFHHDEGDLMNLVKSNSYRKPNIARRAHPNGNPDRNCDHRFLF